MLVKLKQFFRANLEIQDNNDTLSHEQAIQLATAALLIEVSRADFELDESEKQQVIEALRQQFQLDPVTLDDLLKLADEEVSQAHSLYQFTRLVNDYYKYDQKTELIGSMWRVAFADGNLDKYEEHLIRKVAKLIYVTHNDFIRLKLAAASATI